MAKTSSKKDDEKLLNAITKLIEHVGYVKLDLSRLQTALIDKGVISTSDLARAVEKVTREEQKSFDDLESNPEKLMAMMRGKKRDVQ
jgi:hypothetical protein